MKEARPVRVSLATPDVPVEASAGAELRAEACEWESDCAEHPGATNTNATRIHNGNRNGAYSRRAIGCGRRQNFMRAVYARTIPEPPIGRARWELSEMSPGT